MSDKDIDNSGVSRRDTLRSLGAGAGITAGSSLPAFGSNNTTRITIVRNSDGPFIQKQVDTGWYRHEKWVEQIATDARGELLSKPGVKSVGIGAGLSQVNGRKAGHLRVYTDEQRDVHVPDTYQSVPVEQVEEGENIEYCNCNDTSYSFIPGGVPIHTNYGGGSAGCKVELNGNYYLLTCQHLFPCTIDQDKDAVVAQGTSGSYFGYVDYTASNPAHYNSTEDWAIITRDSGGSADGYDNYIEDYSGKLAGHVTKDGLTDYLCSDGTRTVYKQGYKTCKDKGCIVDRAKTDGSCDGSTGGFLRANIHIEKGDSGGILFGQIYSSRDYCYYTVPIGIVSNGPDNSTNNCTPSDYPATDSIDCFSAYALHNQYGMNFDPNFSRC